MMKPNTKIKMAILCGLLGFVVMLLVMNTTGKPSLGTNPYQSGCHSNAGYSITSNATSVNIDPGKSFKIIINAGGNLVEVQAYPGARNNNNFNFQPSVTITDGSTFDINASANVIRVIFTIAAPAQSGTYKIMILARDSSTTNHPNFAYVEITVTVGSGSVSPGVDIGAFFIDHFFNHLDFYIGGAAVVSLALATILYKVDKQRFTKIHGYLSFIAFGLTTINVIMIFSMAGTTFLSYFADPASIAWLHLIHIIVGITGYSFGVLAVLTGLGGIRTCKPGYVALFCWALNLLLGILPAPIGWGLNL